MRCADVRSNLFRYSEGAAGRWWAIRMRMHIARCGACREEMEALRASQRKLAAALKEPVQAPDISRLVMPLLRTSPSPGRVPKKSPLYLTVMKSETTTPE